MVFLPTFLKKERTPPVSKPCLLGKLEKRIRPSGVFRYKPRDSRSENPNSSEMIRISRINPILSTDNEKRKSRNKKGQKIGKRNR
jgi:hypothetical protein